MRSGASRSVNAGNLIFTQYGRPSPVSLTQNRIFVFMRAWFFACIFMLLASTLCRASPVSACSVKSAVAQTAAVEMQHRSQHCDQPEDAEVLTAAYIQSNAFGPVVLNIYHGLKTIIYPAATTPLTSRRDNARLQPFCKLILFPFHVFW
jgi:hypothetical protein